MEKQGINPVAAIAAVVLALLVAGGIWYFAANPAGGKPAPGQAGGADPALGGPNSVMQGAQRPQNAGAGRGPGQPGR